MTKIELFAGIAGVLLMVAFWTGLAMIFENAQREWNRSCLAAGGTLVLDGSFRGPCIIGGKP